MDIGIHSILKSASDSSSFVFHWVEDSLNCCRHDHSLLESSFRFVDETVEELFIQESDIDDVSHHVEVLSWICEWSNEIFDDLVEDVANALLVHFLDVLFVFSHGKLFQLFWIFDDLVDSLELLVLFNVWLILVEAICHKLVDMIVVSQVDSCLIEDVGLHVVWSLFWRYSNLGEPKTRDKAIFLENFVLVDLISSVERLSERLELLDVSLSFSWTKSTQELKLVLEMIMVYKQIDIDTNSVHKLNVSLLHIFNKSSLVDVLLERMKVQVKSLILRHDWTPKIQNLIHWVLFESGKTNGFLQDERMVLQEFLTVMRSSKELWNFRSSPDNKGFLCRIIILVHILVLTFIHLILTNFEVCKFTESLFESLGL